MTSRLDGELTLERIRPKGGYPKLKSKGAACRHLAKYGLKLAQQFANGSDHDNLKILVITQLVRIYDIMEENSQFLTEEAKKEISECCFDMVGAYSVLSAEAFAQGRRLWKFTPKCHLIEHLFNEQCREVGNPRGYWTYADEDLVGLSIDVAQSCHVRTMVPTALVKWLILAFDVT